MSAIASRAGRTLLAVVFAVSSTVPLDATAQPKSATDEARELAKQGVKALDAGDFKDALDKLTRAEALYHAPTHLLLLGNAQAGLGKLADALATFEKLTAEPLPDASPPAFKDAQEKGRKRLKELLARVPSLLVVIETADAKAAVVTVDGQRTDFSNGVAVRANPGEHTIGVQAEGYLPVTRAVTLPEKGGVVRVPIALEKVNGAGPVASGSASGGASAGGTAGPATTAVADGPSANRIAAYVSFGVTGASVVVGAITGAMSLSMTEDLKTRCLENKCPREEQPAIDKANAFAHVSTATFVLGATALTAGVVLLSIDLGSKGTTVTPVTTGRGARVLPGAPAGGARGDGGAAGVARGASRERSFAHVEPWVSFTSAGLRGSF